MKKVTLLVEDEKSDVFLKFVKTLDYAKVLDDDMLEHVQRDSGDEKSKESENQIKEPLKKFLNKM